jgi:hypothetical protein
VLHRCYDLSDLLAVAAAGQAEVAVVAAGTRWLDRDALARLAAAGLAVVGVASAGDEDSERRLRQLGLLHIASEADPPDALVDRARAALAAEPDPGVDRAALAAEPDPGEEPPEPDQVPAPPDGDTRRILAAVWGPKGGPGRTTVAVNLAFEAAAVGGEVLLVDADTYGGAVAHSKMGKSHRNRPHWCPVTCKRAMYRIDAASRMVTRGGGSVMRAAPVSSSARRRATARTRDVKGSNNGRSKSTWTSGLCGIRPPRSNICSNLRFRRSERHVNSEHMFALNRSLPPELRSTPNLCSPLSGNSILRTSVRPIAPT